MMMTFNEDDSSTMHDDNYDDGDIDGDIPAGVHTHVCATQKYT
jgi:hypothetical protein